MRRNLAMTHLEMRQLDNAKQRLLEALWLDPKNAWSNLLAGIILAPNEHWNGACSKPPINWTWRREVYGFCATAAYQFVDLKRALGFTETEARRELVMWQVHNPHRSEVTHCTIPHFESV